MSTSWHRPSPPFALTHFSQLLAMGVDTIHPVLLLEPRATLDAMELSAADEDTEELLKQHAHDVLSGCDEGLRHYMSTVGVASVSAYRGGTHVWQAETLNHDCAALMGLQEPRFSGIGFGRISKWLYTTWRYPSKDGPGLYTYKAARDCAGVVSRIHAGSPSPGCW